MKTIGLGSVLGVVVAGFIIYYLNPQNSASEVLIVTLCIAMGTALISTFSRRRGSEPTNGRRVE